MRAWSGRSGHQAEDVAIWIEGMAPARPDLVELLADATATRLDASSRGSEVCDPKVNVRGHNGLTWRDSLEGESWGWPLAEDEVGTLVHRDRLIGQLAVEAAQPIGVVTAQCDVREVHPPIMSCGSSGARG